MLTPASTPPVLDGIISPLAKQQKAPSKALGLPLWPLLDQLSGDAVPLLARSVAMLAKARRLPKGLSQTVQALLPPLNPSKSDGGAPAGMGRATLWALLLELASVDDKSAAADAKPLVDYAQVQRCWEAARKLGGDGVGEAEAALRLLLCGAQRGAMASGAAASLRTELLGILKGFGAAPSLAVLVVQAAAALEPAAGGSYGWARELMSSCEATLRSAGAETAAAHAALATVGELAMICNASGLGVCTAAKPIVALVQGIAISSVVRRWNYSFDE